MFIYMQLKFTILIPYFHHMDIILRVCRSKKGTNVYIYTHLILWAHYGVEWKIVQEPSE